MRKISIVSLSVFSVFIATTLVGLDGSLAMACSGTNSSGSGLSHGSSVGSSSVTVCVGTQGSSPGSTTTQVITKKVVVSAKPKSKPKAAPKPVSKPAGKPTVAVAPKPVVVSCPTDSERASMPSSADAAERWIKARCSPSYQAAALPKKIAPIKKASPAKTKTKTITEVITIDIPGRSFAAADSVELSPRPLQATLQPTGQLRIGQLGLFSSNPIAHFGTARVLGKQAEVHFVPVDSGWDFSDGTSFDGADTSRSFTVAGNYEAVAFVSYAVSYRLLGETNWQEADGLITIQSNLLEFQVGAAAEPESMAKGALLVGEMCLEGSRSYGCGI